MTNEGSRISVELGLVCVYRDEDIDAAARYDHVAYELRAMVEREFSARAPSTEREATDIVFRSIDRLAGFMIPARAVQQIKNSVRVRIG